MLVGTRRCKLILIWIFLVTSPVWGSHHRYVLESPSTSTANLFGSSIAFSPTHRQIFVGAPRDEFGAGRGYLFTYSTEAQEWGEPMTLSSSITPSAQSFGFSATGGALAPEAGLSQCFFVGAPALLGAEVPFDRTSPAALAEQCSRDPTRVGAVHVICSFKDRWVEVSRFEGDYPLFGYSVATAGRCLAIGSPCEQPQRGGGSGHLGAVHLYCLANVLRGDSPGAADPMALPQLQWRHVTFRNLTAGAARAEAFFGASVALSSHCLLGGSLLGHSVFIAWKAGPGPERDDDGGSGPEERGPAAPWSEGLARAAARDPALLASILTEPEGDIPSGWLTHPLVSGQGDDRFGLSVALSAAGLTAAVGAPFAAQGSGAVYVYRECAPESRRWGRLEQPDMCVHRQLVVPQGGRPGDHFGSWLTIDEAALTVGAPDADASPVPRWRRLRATRGGLFEVRARRGITYHFRFLPTYPGLFVESIFWFDGGDLAGSLHHEGPCFWVAASSNGGLVSRPPPPPGWDGRPIVPAPPDPAPPSAGPCVVVSYIGDDAPTPAHTGPASEQAPVAPMPRVPRPPPRRRAAAADQVDDDPLRALPRGMAGLLRRATLLLTCCLLTMAAVLGDVFWHLLLARAQQESDEQQRNPFGVLVSIRAPPMVGNDRAPLRLVVCIDRSGSMEEGEKLNLVKVTLPISFPNLVSADLPLVRTDEIGKQRVMSALAGLVPWGNTDLAGGLCRALEVLSRPPDQTPDIAAVGSPHVNAVILMTDGRANVGLRDPNPLMEQLRGWLSFGPGAAGRPPVVHCFGFGAECPPLLLRAIADASGGIFYHIQEARGIPGALGECLGGLLSLAARGVAIRLAAGPAATLVRVQGPRAPLWDDGGAAATLLLGDLYADEARDVLAWVLPPLRPTAADTGSPAAPEPTGGAVVELLEAVLTFDDLHGSHHEQRARLRLARGPPTQGPPVGSPARPEGAPSLVSPSAPRLVEAHSCRYLAAECLGHACRAAVRGDHAEARSLLQSCMARLQTSPACEEPLVVGLLGDLQSIRDQLARWDGDPRGAASVPTPVHTLETMAQAHLGQRANAQAMFSTQTYATASQRASTISLTRVAQPGLLGQAEDEASFPRIPSDHEPLRRTRTTRNLLVGFPPPFREGSRVTLMRARLGTDQAKMAKIIFQLRKGNEKTSNSISTPFLHSLLIFFQFELDQHAGVGRSPKSSGLRGKPPKVGAMAEKAAGVTDLVLKKEYLAAIEPPQPVLAPAQADPVPPTTTAAPQTSSALMEEPRPAAVPPSQETKKHDRTQDADEKGGKKKGRFNFKKGPRDRSIEICNAVASGGKCTRPNCKFSHDLAAWLPSRPADIPGLVCPAHAAGYRCPFGFGCRAGLQHSEGDRCTDTELPKRPPLRNIVPLEASKQIRRRQYPFTRSDAVILGLLGVAATIPALASAIGAPAAAAESPLGGGLALWEPRKIDWRGKLYLAPLTTVGNLPFRRVCKDFGCDITCGEMALASKLLQGHPSELALLRRHPCEDIFGAQLAGCNPETMAHCAEMLDRECSLDFLDLNCGCPVDQFCDKVAPPSRPMPPAHAPGPCPRRPMPPAHAPGPCPRPRPQWGMCASLLGRPAKMESIVRCMTQACICISPHTPHAASEGPASRLPVIVKMRMGLNEKAPVAHEIIPRMHTWGAAAVVLHGRSRNQRYSRTADWEYIERVAAGSTVPVLGNGDLFQWQDVVRHLEGTSLHSVMLARGPLIKPWFFTEIKERRTWDISAPERLDVLRRFTGYGLEHWGSDTKGVETTRRFLLEWMSMLCRYVPPGLIETGHQQQLNLRVPRYQGRSDLESLLGSSASSDWVRVSEMLLGHVPDGFTFTPRHKSNAY
ncbi:putative tRNA-dihydrouridine synthase; conserved site [Paratrimastix pyriformis]|uniref:tRNA-dihydrouridine(47) synthase [NAD(P)(+)] n=1 Tax=Paratrimastix pyriformis TaxID=342808 RepID=A0ABQ8UD54_9EUKA|nr:putative tRNA-dihydrouridine synthase; conserved site [Paratrimastix pyriformis]